MDMPLVVHHNLQFVIYYTKNFLLMSFLFADFVLISMSSLICKRLLSNAAFMSNVNDFRLLFDDSIFLLSYT